MGLPAYFISITGADSSEDKRFFAASARSRRPSRSFGDKSSKGHAVDTCRIIFAWIWRASIWSISLPPRRIPATASSDTSLFSIEIKLMSSVPPPQSKTATLLAPANSSRHLTYAAVGSLTNDLIHIPALCAASRKSARCSDEKSTGIAMTASFMAQPAIFSTRSLI